MLDFLRNTFFSSKGKQKKNSQFTYEDNFDIVQKRNIEYAEKMATHLNLSPIEKKMFIDGVDFTFNTKGYGSGSVNNIGLITYVENEARSRDVQLEPNFCMSILKELDEKYGICDSQ